MRVITIPKKNGKARTIYIPNEEEKRKIRGQLGELNRKAMRLCNPLVVQGFMPGKSPVTNATQHIGHTYTLCMDLTDFFDTVTPDKVRGKLNKEQMDTCFVDGAARQGLPTSPVIANLSAIAMDAAIIKWIQKSGKNIVYTRYADDLCFSFDDEELIPLVKHHVVEIVGRCGFKLNPHKTLVQCSKAGRRVICGVGVDDSGIHPTREVKRRLRAAKHHGHTRKARGLEEWIQLKSPNIQKKAGTKQAEEQIEGLRRFWALEYIDINKAVAEKVIPEQNLGNNIIITNDPVYFMGMSTITTGWKNCMKQPDGFYRKGVMSWLALSGTSVAVFLSHHTMIVGDVERRQMRARCLVHCLTDGTRVYDKLYGNPDDTPVLAKKLEEAGFIQISEAQRGMYVEGDIPAKLQSPYLDNLKKEFIRLDGKSKYRFHT